ncbi:MAG: hypothetical protein AB9846_04195 [Tenuifilaceae bacterium]
MELLSFGVWWEDLSALNKIYWMISVPASLIFIIQLGLTFLGSKSDKVQLETSGNTSIESETEITFQLFNFKNLIGFFTSFGWSGLACIDSGLSTSETILISIACGVIIMITMAIIFYFMEKLLKTAEDL